MRTCIASGLAIGLAIGLDPWTPAASAQPSATDLGPLPLGATHVLEPTLAAGEVLWYRFSISATSASVYLDIDTHGSLLVPANDTELGLYSDAGVLRASDDNDGDGSRSILTFGGTCQPRGPFGASIPYDGRDGALAAGSYYLALASFNTTFGASDWNASSASPNAGPARITITYADTDGTLPGVFFEGCAADAAEMPPAARPVSGQAGVLHEIRGVIGESDADAYLIEICDIASFSATTTDAAGFDTQLWLLLDDGTGLAANDDNPAGGRQSRLSGAFVPETGRYVLAVSGFDRDPVDAVGAALWEDLPSNVERPPDGPGLANPVAAWQNDNTPLQGPYTIRLTGACFLVNEPCIGDVDRDADVDLQDVAFLLSNFSVLEGAVWEQGDMDADGDVDLQDLAYVLGNFSRVC